MDNQVFTIPYTSYLPIRSTNTRVQDWLKTLTTKVSSFVSQENEIDRLLNSAGFINFVEKNRKEFLNNPDKFSSLAEKDWE